MRYFQVLLLILFVSSCASTEKKEVDSGKASAESAMQHVYVSGVMAQFYCDNQNWPTSIDELSAFSNSNPTPIGSKINWSLLSKFDVTFKVTNDVYLRTPEDKIKGSMSVSSIHHYPGCNGDSIKINFQPTLGG
jgi:hypothetical protein